MIIDSTGVILIPGNYGRDCPANGENPDVECCCDECDYMRCCFDETHFGRCQNCAEKDCPRAGNSALV